MNSPFPISRVLRVSMFAMSLAVVACTATPSLTLAPRPAARQVVALSFAAEVAGKAFVCGQSYPGIGTTSSTITPSDFRFFVSEVALIDAAGQAVPVSLVQDGIWQVDTVALLDFEDGSASCRNGTPATNSTVRGTVPAGRYVGVRFSLGVPFARNHGDPTVAPSPLNLTAMFWNWQGGYKFVKFDTATTGLAAAHAGPMAGQAATAASGFSVHLGSTVCASASRTQSPSACQNPNRVTVQFDHFDASRQTIVADIGSVLSRANVDINTLNTSPGCMSFPNDADCPEIMGAFGLAYGGVAARGSQRFLSVR